MKLIGLLLLLQNEPCASHRYIVDLLKNQYSEHVVGRGASSAGTIMELLLGPGRSWTIIETREHETCIVATGTDWQTLHGQFIVQ